MKKTTVAIVLSLLVVLGAIFCWDLLFRSENGGAGGQGDASVAASRSTRDRSKTGTVPVVQRREVQVSDQELRTGVDRTEDVADAIDEKFTDGESIQKLFSILEDEGATLLSREEALNHLGNLMADPKPGEPDAARFVALAVKPSTHPYLADKMQAQTMNWGDDQSKLEANFELMQSRDDAVGDDSREMLEFYLDLNADPDANPGKDWAKWRELLDTYYKEKAEEEKNAVKEPAPASPAAGEPEAGAGQ